MQIKDKTYQFVFHSHDFAIFCVKQWPVHMNFRFLAWKLHILRLHANRPSQFTRQICAYLCGKVCAFTNFRFQILNAVVTAICFSTVTSSGHYGDKISALDIVTIALVSLRIFGHRFFFGSLDANEQPNRAQFMSTCTNSSHFVLWILQLANKCNF